MAHGSASLLGSLAQACRGALSIHPTPPSHKPCATSHESLTINDQFLDGSFCIHPSMNSQYQIVPQIATEIVPQIAYNNRATNSQEQSCHK